MRIAIEVAGFTPAESDGFRRAMGTWRSTTEMEKLHARFVDGCVAMREMPREDAEELFGASRGSRASASRTSHAAAFARTAYEVVLPQALYPAPVPRRVGQCPAHGLLSGRGPRQRCEAPRRRRPSCRRQRLLFHRTTTEWAAGRVGAAGPAGDGGSAMTIRQVTSIRIRIQARPAPVRSPACVIPDASARKHWAVEGAMGWGVRLGFDPSRELGASTPAWLNEERGRGT